MRFAILKEYNKNKKINEPDKYPMDWTFHLIAEDGRIWKSINHLFREYIICNWHQTDLDFTSDFNVQGSTAKDYQELADFDFEAFIKEHENELQVLFGNGTIQIIQPQAFQISYVTADEYAELHNKDRQAVKKHVRDDRLEYIRTERTIYINRYCPWPCNITEIVGTKRTPAIQINKEIAAGTKTRNVQTNVHPLDEAPETISSIRF